MIIKFNTRPLRLEYIVPSTRLVISNSFNKKYSVMYIDSHNFVNPDNKNNNPYLYIFTPFLPNNKFLFQKYPYSYNPLSQLNSLSENSESTNSPAAILDSYSLVSYGGTLNYNYDVQYTYNATDVAIPWKPTVTRSTSSQTSIKVSGGFDKAFQAEVGKTFATTESWSHAFDISIPKKTQYEIWTWNVAEYWTFKVQPFVGSSSNFAVYRPTSTYGHSIYVFDYPRDPR